MIQLRKEEKAKLISDIQEFFENERDEEIGILAAELVLDFFVESLGNKVYNIALTDAKQFLTEKMDNMDADYHMLYK